MNATTLGRLIRTFWVIPAAVVAAVLFGTGHVWLGAAVDLLIVGNAVASLRDIRRSKKRMNASAVEFVNAAASKVLELHQPLGDYAEYCSNCGAGTAWPCPQYVQAMSLLSESDKSKAKLAPTLIIEMWG